MTVPKIIGTEIEYGVMVPNLIRPSPTAPATTSIMPTASFPLRDAPMPAISCVMKRRGTALWRSAAPATSRMPIATRAYFRGMVLKKFRQSALCRGWVLSQPLLGARPSQWDLDAQLCPPIPHRGHSGSFACCAPFKVAQPAAGARRLSDLLTAGMAGRVPRDAVRHRLAGSRSSSRLYDCRGPMPAPFAHSGDRGP
jgi:hypothetical protein